MWPFSSAPTVYTGKLLSADEVRSQLGAGYLTTLGKAQYAEVNSAAVIWLAQQTQSALFSVAPHWEPDATCTLFAATGVSVAGQKFAGQAFSDKISETLCALAFGEVWFHPDSDPTSGHAINFALTEKGVLHIDPQAPNALRPMSANEIAGRYFLRLL